MGKKKKKKTQVVVVCHWAAFYTGGGNIFSALMNKFTSILQPYFVLGQPMVNTLYLYTFMLRNNAELFSFHFK